MEQSGADDGKSKERELQKKAKAVQSARVTTDVERFRKLAMKEVLRIPNTAGLIMAAFVIAVFIHWKQSGRVTKEDIKKAKQA